MYQLPILVLQLCNRGWVYFSFRTLWQPPVNPTCRWQFADLPWLPLYSLHPVRRILRKGTPLTSFFPSCLSLNTLSPTLSLRMAPSSASQRYPFPGTQTNGRCVRIPLQGGAWISCTPPSLLAHIIRFLVVRMWCCRCRSFIILLAR